MTEYADRRAVAEALRSSRRIAFPPALGEPDLLGELPDLVDGPVELLVPFRTRRLSLEDLGSTISIRAAFGGRGVRPADYAQVTPRQVSAMIRDDGPLAIDAALVRLSPADNQGMHNVGPSASLTGDLVRAARTVIAEIDPDLPCTEGDTTIPTSCVTLQIEATTPLELPEEHDVFVPTDSERRLARRVAELVPDHAHVQLGMGAVTRAIPEALDARSGLRIIAGLVTPEIAGMRERGALDERWQMPTGEAVGPGSFMELIDRNPSLMFQSTRQLHDVGALGSLPGLVTINAAIAVDVLGRVSCESFGAEVRGGIGGLPEFLMAGRLSPGGVNIVVLTSTSARGSRIVHRLISDDVSIPAFLVDYVVTDWGVADLRGATRAERRERIIAVADPAHSNDLESSRFTDALEAS